MKLSIASFLFVALLFSFGFLESTTIAGSSLCDSKCGVRCSKASLQERCLKYCGICCAKCNSCVPYGTFGNRDECPCYRDLKNSKGKPKCPYLSYLLRFIYIYKFRKISPFQSSQPA